MARYRLLAATNNPHKIVELRRLLSNAPVSLVTPAALDLSLDVTEDGKTYAENALLKARAFAQASGIPALADDSGIEVDALYGRPGLHSARYGGSGLDDESRVERLLDEMASVPDDERSCRYIVVLAIAWPDGRFEVFNGLCHGTVARARTGTNGFGYDPAFFVPELKATMGQLSSEEKDAISHRGQAAKLVVNRLRELVAEVAR